MAEMRDDREIMRDEEIGEILPALLTRRAAACIGNLDERTLCGGRI
jgi:hypothetical protein